MIANIFKAWKIQLSIIVQIQIDFITELWSNMHYLVIWINLEIFLPLEMKRANAMLKARARAIS